MSAHDRVVAELRRRIATGHYPFGARLPALRRVADELGVTEPVVGGAVGELKRAGLLRSVPGVGVWVVDEVADTVRMRLELDAVRAGEDPSPMPADAAPAAPGEEWLVPFPAAWIQRLLDERAELASRLAGCECADTMASTRNS